MVLEGGGALGAYEAGALYSLTQNLPAAEVMYDVVSGVSIGAINSAAIGVFPKGKPAEMSDWLIGMWNDISIP